VKLASLIPAEAILEQLEATDRKVALKEMVGALAVAGRIDEGKVSALVKALMSREELGSTGIGKGVAVPHARHDGVQGLVGAFGRSSEGVDFSALDGQPVHLVFLLLSSNDASGELLEALARVAKLVRDDRFCRFLRGAKDKEEIAELLLEADAQLDTAGATGS
jgi:mannitol/fructose-specific phosphotransferase system IIA component (Ntr-type)